MQRERLYETALKNMARIVHKLASKVPAPQRIPYKDSFVFRYMEKTVHQALVQKLARIVTTLRATHLLMTVGFLQEQAALQRILGELHEDVIFLSYSAIFNELTTLHQQYLNSFYEEEFDAETPLESTQKRPMVSRKKIQAYIAHQKGSDPDPSRSIELARTITKAYSGYIHAASPQIMDMYGGNPAHFHVDGMFGTEHHDEYRYDLWNYFYRSIFSFFIAAKAFGDEDLSKQIHVFLLEFEKMAGQNYSQNQ